VACQFSHPVDLAIGWLLFFKNLLSFLFLLRRERSQPAVTSGYHPKDARRVKFGARIVGFGAKNWKWWCMYAM